MPTNLSETIEAVEQAARCLREFQEMRVQFANVLDFLVPEEGNALIALGGRKWPHWPSLRDEIVLWLAGGSAPEHLRPHQRGSFLSDSGEAGVEVEADHLLSDYWLVWTYPADAGPERGIEAAVAVVRAGGSGHRPALSGWRLGPHLPTGRPPLTGPRWPSSGPPSLCSLKRGPL